MLTSVIYACALTLVIFSLSMRVITLRRQHRVSVGDNDILALKTACGAQSNAIEYIPIFILLLFALEINQAPLWLIHIIGIIFVIARVLHARAMLSANLPQRVLGMKMTFFTLLALVGINLVWLIYMGVFQ